jgi:hypothetical protein
MTDMTETSTQAEIVTTLPTMLKPWFVPHFHELRKKLTYVGEQDTKKRKLLPTHLASAGTGINTLGGTCQGEQYLQQAHLLLDSFTETRSPDQKRFHDNILTVFTPLIYKKDFLMKRDDLLAGLNRQTFPMGSLIMTPRRFGNINALLFFVCTHIPCYMPFPHPHEYV